MRSFSALALAVATIVTVATTSQGAITVNWSGGGDFDDATISFGGFTANQLTDISDTGNFAYWHNHGGGPMSVTIEVHVNSAWQTIFSSITPIDGGQSHYLKDVVTPIAFTGGTVDAIRLSSNPNQGFSFHGFDNTLAFTFDNVAPNSAVPEPASLAIWGLGALGCVAAAYRRRKRGLGTVHSNVGTKP